VEADHRHLEHEQIEPPNDRSGGKAFETAGSVRMKRGIILLAGMMLLLAAPALAQSKAEIQKLNDKWAEAFNKGDTATVAAMYTEDAYLLPAGAQMLKGRSAIEGFWRQSMQQLGDVKCTTIDVKPLGGSAAREIGTCSFKTKAQPPQAGALKYAVVWQKEGGRWKLLQDIWNSDK
jgi:uncharacterized protein (TIGR02246 family)